jgi:hypothetical protein
MIFGTASLSTRYCVGIGKGVDVQAKLPLLSTYMGHVSIVSTQYYIQFVESLSAAASTLFEKRYGKLLAEVRGSDGGEK